MGRWVAWWRRGTIPLGALQENSLGPEVMSPWLSLIQVPWEDLRYLFGEIMYGGHITDDWDRRLCRVYLEEFMNPALVRYCSFHSEENSGNSFFKCHFIMYIMLEYY